MVVRKQTGKSRKRAEDINRSSQKKKKNNNNKKKTGVL